MRSYKRIISLGLILVTVILCFVSCKNEELSYGGDGTTIVYDPYDNILKDPVDMGDPISVSGKTFAFESVDVRNSIAEKQVTLGNALRKLYLGSKFKFTSESKVSFEDDNDELYFVMSNEEGVRFGNVLTVKHTNNDGVQYDVRFEIHNDMIYVIHNGHTYDKEGVFATLIYKLV